MNNKTKNFQSKVWMACGSDSLRSSNQLIAFNNGYLYATDNHLMIRQHLSIHNFTEHEIEILNGKFLHRDVVQEIYKYDYIEVKGLGIRCVHKKGFEAYFYFDKFDGKHPNIQDLIDKQYSGKCKQIEKIGVNLTLLMKIKDCFVDNSWDSIKLSFYGERLGIKLNSTNNDFHKDYQIAVLMPVVVE